MNDPNITMEEYIRLEEENARMRGKVYNWETVTYGKIWYDEDVHDLRSVETEFPAKLFNDALTSEVTLSCEPMSVFPDYLYGVSKHHGYGVLTFWALSSLYLQHSLYDVFVKRIQRMRHKYQYGVFWGMDMAYRLPVQFKDLLNENDDVGGVFSGI
ncbi:hypothetical protein Tco_0637505 [Tanacetum coccineum]